MIEKENLKYFEENFNPEICGTIILAYRNDLNNFQIIDGQHRLTLLIKMDNLNKFNNSKILVKIINIKNDIEFKSYLNALNNNKNFEYGQLHKYKMDVIIAELEKKFGSKLVRGKNRPSLNCQKFRELLINTNDYLNFNMKPIDIINKLVNINLFLEKNF